jgi:hypothetical protein
LKNAYLQTTRSQIRIRAESKRKVGEGSEKNNFGSTTLAGPLLSQYVKKTSTDNGMKFTIFQLMIILEFTLIRLS